MKRILVLIGKNEQQKKSYISKLRGYEIYYNPENDKHPEVQRKFIEKIIQDANTNHKKICISTNSKYVLYTIDHLVDAGKIKNKLSKSKFTKIMRNVNNYILIDDLDVLEISNEVESIIEDDSILISTFDMEFMDYLEQQQDRLMDAE